MTRFVAGPNESAEGWLNIDAGDARQQPGANVPTADRLGSRAQRLVGTCTPCPIQHAGLKIQSDAATYWTAARVEDDLFQVTCFSPLRIPEGSRRDIAEAIARANHGLRVGKFELAFDDGELRFQASQILDGDAVGLAVIERMIGSAVNMLDVYLPAFMSVVYGNEELADAVQRVEAGFGRSDE